MDILSFTSSHMSCNARTWNLTIRAEVESCVYSSRDLKLYLKDPCFAYQFSFSHETKLSREQIVRAVNDPSDGLNVLKALGIREKVSGEKRCVGRQRKAGESGPSRFNHGSHRPAHLWPLPGSSPAGQRRGRDSSTHSPRGSSTSLAPSTRWERRPQYPTWH